MRAVVVGASSGLGRCIGVGLGRRGAQVALLARRVDRLERAAADAGPGARAIECDVTDQASIASAIGKAAADLGGIDALVYTPAIGHVAHLAEVDAETWQRMFQTNVTGAALVTAAALPHLAAASGTAVYLSSVSASQTPPWPGLAAYGVTKAALERLVHAFRVEYPGVNFTCCIVGDCAGGEGEGATGFANEWDWDLAAEFHPIWAARGLLAGSLMDVEDLVHVVDGILRAGPTMSTPTVVLAPRTPAPPAR